jgi:hypothetical protein
VGTTGLPKLPVPLSVVLWAKPQHVEVSGVIVVMGLHFILYATAFTRLLYKGSRSNRQRHRLVRRTFLGVARYPASRVIPVRDPVPGRALPGIRLALRGEPPLAVVSLYALQVVGAVLVRVAPLAVLANAEVTVGHLLVGVVVG